ncbi:hypothetical protein CPF11_01205 [Acetobacter pomorum]|nr:hypothetical protein CPF11_01205 [Acetobacter pomorum]
MLDSFRRKLRLSALIRMTWNDAAEDAEICCVKPRNKPHLNELIRKRFTCVNADDFSAVRKSRLIARIAYSVCSESLGESAYFGWSGVQVEALLLVAAAFTFPLS